MSNYFFFVEIDYIRVRRMSLNAKYHNFSSALLLSLTAFCLDKQQTVLRNVSFTSSSLSSHTLTCYVPIHTKIENNPVNHYLTSCESLVTNIENDRVQPIYLLRCTDSTDSLAPECRYLLKVVCIDIFGHHNTTLI